MATNTNTEIRFNLAGVLEIYIEPLPPSVSDGYTVHIDGAHEHVAPPRWKEYRHTALEHAFSEAERVLHEALAELARLKEQAHA